VKKRDCTLAIDGFVGEGKTTFAVQCLKTYYDIKNLPQFRKIVQKYMVYNRKELYDLATNEHEKLIIADESINLLFRREWMKDDQIVLLKAFDVCRSNRNIFIFNVPSFWSLDSHTVQTRIRYWVHCDKQKYATLFRPVRHPFVSDVWCRKWNEKIFDGRAGIKRSPNYIDTFAFEPLTEKEYDACDEVKNSKRLNLDDKEDKPELTTKQVIAFIKERQPDISHAYIAGVLGCTRQNVDHALRQSRPSLVSQKAKSSPIPKK
jgi:hypothetical protein